MINFHFHPHLSLPHHLVVHWPAQGHPDAASSFSSHFLYTNKLQMWWILLLTVAVCILSTFFLGRYLTPITPSGRGQHDAPRRKMKLEEAIQDGNEKMIRIWNPSVQVGAWTMKKARHVNDFRYIVDIMGEAQLLKDFNKVFKQFDPKGTQKVSEIRLYLICCWELDIL